MEFISHSEAETEALGEKLARSLPEHGVVIAMYGELGAGKTAFVRGLARGLEVDGAVTSPTFTIVNELYGKRDLFHFDMYRLGSADELFDIGWEDYLDRGGVCAVASLLHTVKQKRGVQLWKPHGTIPLIFFWVRPHPPGSRATLNRCAANPGCRCT